jgi:hypothetical protein
MVLKFNHDDITAHELLDKAKVALAKG